MASRAHIIHDYSFGTAHSRPRQLLLRRDDPVVLPRTSMWRAGGGALATALAMGALVVGSAYAAFHEAPPQLAETPALAPLEGWQPDPSLGAAHVTNSLLGPAFAAPDKAAPFVAADSEPFVSSSSESRSFESSAPESRPESRDVIIDDSKMYPPAQPAPYPNPTTTPPDAIAPAAADPRTPTPALAPENPYRD